MRLVRLLECGIHDLRLSARHDRILITVQNQYWNAEIRGMQARRVAPQLDGVGPDLLAHYVTRIPPTVAIIDQQGQIADPSNAHGTVKDVAVALRSEQCDVAAKAPAHDAHPRRVGGALRDRPAGAIHHVVVGQAAPILVRGVEPVVTIAFGAAKVHLQHGISAAGQELAQEEILPAVAGNGSAVRHDDQRKLSSDSAGWQSQIPGNTGSIARRETDRPHGAQARRLDFRIRKANGGDDAAIDIEHPVTQGIDVTPASDDIDLLVLGGVHYGNELPWNGLPHRFGRATGTGINVFNLRKFRLVMDPEQVAVYADDRTRHIDLGIRVQ